jgi:hypothetical protein
MVHPPVVHTRQTMIQPGTSPLCVRRKLPNPLYSTSHLILEELDGKLQQLRCPGQFV